VPGAGIKAINKRIRSVRSTQQITKAMKMVAAAKLRRAQDRLLAGRPYAEKLAGVLSHLAESGEGTHPLLATRPVVRKRLYITVTSDKGLAGAYNMNVIKVAQAGIEKGRREGIGCEVYAIGKKARDYFAKRGFTLLGSHADFGGEATADRARMIAERVMAAFLDGTFDEVRLVYARFVSTLTQRPTDERLLPIARGAVAERPATTARAGAPAQADAQDEHCARDYIWEPGREELYRLLLPLYLRNRVYIALCEAYASEHGARMTSMTAATDNAGELIDFLTLRRNRERQAAITQELSEIVGGANAL
jgi:F-type H+-transporting ATPase subunit gamma